MRSLPEHSVDCWTAIAVRDVFPRASIWAPTQNNVNNWDMAMSGLGPYKALLFENKGCEYRPASPRRGDDHTITIDVGQLTGWASKAGVPVFYVLPVPPWRAAPPRGDVPLVAQCALPTMPPLRCPGCRTSHTTGFGDWAWVTRADRLLSVVGRWTTAATYTREAGALARSCSAVPLSTFLSQLRACEHVPLTQQGKPQIWDEQDEAAQRQQVPRVERKPGSGLLAILPAVLTRLGALDGAHPYSTPTHDVTPDARRLEAA